MNESHEERLLIITKTYPIPSKSYRETVCVASINEQNELRRLYPIAFRFLRGEQQFHRWQWIRAKISKSSDRRPESYNLDNDSIVLEEILSTSRKGGWQKRSEIIKRHRYSSFLDLENSRLQKGTSLGFIKPLEFSLSIVPAKQKTWTEEQLASLKTEGLFDPVGAFSKPIVQKIPFDIYYDFKTEDDETQYHHLITDWEVGALYWNCQKLYKDEWEIYFRKKLEDEFRKKDLWFLMGTMHQFPHQWLIIGLFYPPKQDYQMSLLDQY